MRHRTEMLHSQTWHKCFICGLPTKTIDICFEAAVHPWPCLRIADRRYWKAVGK